MTHHAYYCSADGCKSNSKDYVSFFRIPKDPDRCQQWKNALGFVAEHKFANIPPEEAHKYIRICKTHFDDRSFTSSGKRLLTTAVPLKLLPEAYGKSADDGTSNSSKVPMRTLKEPTSKRITLEDVFKFFDENYPPQATTSIKAQLAELDKKTKEIRLIGASSGPERPILDEQPNEVEVAVTHPADAQIKIEKQELQNDEDTMEYEATISDEVKEEDDPEEEAVEPEPDGRHPIQAFFDSMAVTVMQFPPPLAVRAKVEVLQVVSKLELEMWESQSGPSTSTASTYFDRSYSAQKLISCNKRLREIT